MKDLSLNSSQHLDNIVTQFEDEWKAPATTQIEHVLAQHPEVERLALLTELLLVEFELVSGSTNSPQRVVEYVRRFPESALLVLDVWDRYCSGQSSKGSIPEANLSTPAAGMDVTVLSSPGRPGDEDVTHFDGGGRRPKVNADHIIGRYYVIEKIGHGGHGNCLPSTRSANKAGGRSEGHPVRITCLVRRKTSISKRS